jgi:hypothetical protein
MERSILILHSPQGAESAKNIHFVFAADPPYRMADRKDGKHKGYFA